MGLPLTLTVVLTTGQHYCATEVFLAPRKSFDILALYKSDYYYYYYCDDLVSIVLLLALVPVSSV